MFSKQYPEFSITYFRSVGPFSYNYINILYCITHVFVCIDIRSTIFTLFFTIFTLIFTIRSNFDLQILGCNLILQSIICLSLLKRRNRLILKRLAGLKYYHSIYKRMNYRLCTLNALMALSTAITITPTSANIAYHIFAIPTAPNTRHPNLTTKANTIF